MKRWIHACIGLLALGGCKKIDSHGAGERFVPASDPALRFTGRWDLSDPALPRASWPGFSVTTDFQGNSIQVRMTDPGNYFNVEIDGRHHSVIGGRSGRHSTYLLADGLDSGPHRVRLQRRNISFDEPTVLEGFVVDEGAHLSKPTDSPELRIEFIGDSFTAAEGNEATSATLPWKDKYPVTDFTQGYAAVLGRAMGAEITAVCRSGSGVVCTWNGVRENPMGVRYGWTLMEKPEPAWSFPGPSPDVVVISLGLNDASGLQAPDGSMDPGQEEIFREGYRRLVAQVRTRHPDARIVALAPYVPWVRESVVAVVNELTAAGETKLQYAQFDKFGDRYVADGHPTVAIHRKMAAQILEQFVRLGIAPAGSAIPKDQER